MPSNGADQFEAHSDSHVTVYQCPGEPYTISRAVHLGRLARGYPKCRECPHREDTGSLTTPPNSPEADCSSSAAPSLLFNDEGVRGIYLNELNRQRASQLGAAFAAILLQRSDHRPQSSAQGLREQAPWQHVANGSRGTRLSRFNGPTVVVGHDERPSSPDLATGVIQAVRSAGCQVVDVSRLSGACLRFTIRYLEADAGVMITGGNAARHINGLRFYGPQAVPITRKSGLEEIEQSWSQGAHPRRRRAGPLRYFQAEIPYAASLLKYFHGLRPLRVAVASPLRVLQGHLDRVFESAACTLVWLDPPRSSATQWMDLAQERADVGAVIDEDDRVTFYDENGQPVPAPQAAALLANEYLRAHNGAPIVLAESLAPMMQQALTDKGAHVLFSREEPSAMWRAIEQHHAVLAIDADFRYWFYDAGPVRDPLMALAALLGALSWSDRPLSNVLEPID